MIITELVEKYRIYLHSNTQDRRLLNGSKNDNIIAHYSNHFGSIFLMKPNRIYVVFSGISNNLQHDCNYSCFATKRIELKKILEFENLEGFEILDKEEYEKFKIKLFGNSL